MILKSFHRLLLLFAFVCIGFMQLKGQEYPWSLQYITNMQTINPAYVGIWDKSTLLLSTKTNWVGISGAPLAQYVNYSTPFSEQQSGIGFSLQRLNIGHEKQLYLTADYSYRLRFDMKHYLQMGLRGGIVNYDNNLKDYQPYPDYIPDPNTIVDVKLHNMTVFGIGAVFFSENYYLSLSVPQIISNTFKANLENYATSTRYKTMFLSGGYVFGSEGNVRFRPNVLVALTSGYPTYADFASIVYLPSNLQFGVNVRTTGQVCFFSQYTVLDRIKIGYALDYSITSDIRRFQLGTHEIMIGYDFNIYKRKSLRLSFF